MRIAAAVAERDQLRECVRPFGPLDERCASRLRSVEVGVD